MAWCLDVFVLWWTVCLNGFDVQAMPISRTLLINYSETESLAQIILNYTNKTRETHETA